MNGLLADRDHAEILQDERHDLVVAGLVRLGVHRVEAVPRLCGRHMWAAGLVTWWGCVMPVGTVPRVAVRKGLWDVPVGTVPRVAVRKEEHLRDVMTLTLT